MREKAREKEKKEILLPHTQKMYHFWIASNRKEPNNYNFTFPEELSPVSHK